MSDLIGDLGSTLLVPGEDFAEIGTVEVYIYVCRTNFTTTTEVIMDEP